MGTVLSRFAKMNIKRESAIIRQMLYLLATIRNGKITRTAEENGIKISNLSMQLKDLEEATGAALLNRKSDGVEPTPAGLELCELAQEFEEILQRFRDWQSSLQQEKAIYLYLPACLKMDLTAYDGEADVVVVGDVRDCDVAVELGDAQVADDEIFETTKVIVQSNAMTFNLRVVCRQKDNEEAVALYKFLVDSMI